MFSEPVELYLERRCTYRSRGKNAKGNPLPGCEHCRRGKLHVDHLGAPPSMNEGGSGLDRLAYQAIKHAWMEALRAQVRAAGLAGARWEAVQVEAQVGFPTYAGRDEGNIRWMLEKALGDMLVEEGVIPKDTFFPERRYTMGNLEGVHSPGRSWLRLLILRSAVTVAPRGVKAATAEDRPGPTLGE